MIRNIDFRISFNDFRPDNFVVQLVSVLSLVVGSFCQTAYCQFDNIYNIPPYEVTSGEVFGSNTQVNLLTGGNITADFSLGNTDGSSTNVEFNGSGGQLFIAYGYAGSVVNLTGSNWSLLSIRGLANISAGTGQVVDVHGIVNFSGATLDEAIVESGGTFNASGGTFGLTVEDGGIANIFAGITDRSVMANSGSSLNIHGGVVEAIFQLPMSKIRMTSGSMGEGNRLLGTFDLEGGTIGDYSRISGEMNVSGGDAGEFLRVFSGAEFNLYGSEFYINGQMITGLTPGQKHTITLRDRNSTLSGVLTDGSTFSYGLDPGDGLITDHFASDATLTVTLVPIPEPTLAWFGFSVAGVFCIRRRRRRTML